MVRRETRWPGRSPSASIRSVMSQRRVGSRRHERAALGEPAPCGRRKPARLSRCRRRPPPGPRTSHDAAGVADSEQPFSRRTTSATVLPRNACRLRYKPPPVPGCALC